MVCPITGSARVHDIMHAESVVETQSEFAPSFDQHHHHHWTEHRSAGAAITTRASTSPTATASQPRLQVQVPMSGGSSGAGTLSHYPPVVHYNPHLPSSYPDRPFASSSPTDSSPSGSPFHPDHRTLARISTTTRPLFLAQHSTPLTPTNLESLSLASPVVTAQPPPAPHAFVDKIVAHPPPPPPMAYVSPHHAHYSFPTVYNPHEVGAHRHQLQGSGYAYYPHPYDYSTDSYRMNPGQTSGVVDESQPSSSYETPPLVLGHFTPTSQVPSGGGGVWSPVESPHYGPGAPGQVGHHSHRPPIQTQLLLANAMPITTDIVSPTHGSMEGSVAASASFVPGMVRQYGNPTTSATAHGSGGYASQATIASSQPLNQGEGITIPVQNQSSSFTPVGVPVSTSTMGPIMGTQTEQQIVKTEQQATHEGEVEGQQYAQVEQNQSVQQQMDGNVPRSSPDGPEVPRSIDPARELVSTDKIDEPPRDERHSTQGETTSAGQKTELNGDSVHNVGAPMGSSSQHAPQPTDKSIDVETRYTDVAVAQPTALVSRDENERFDRNQVDACRDERANVVSRGADNSTEDAFNSQDSTLKAQTANQSGSTHHSSTTDPHDPSSLGHDTRHTLPDAGVAPTAHVNSIHTTGISTHVDIDHSYSVPLQTPATPHHDMQAISSAPFHHPFNNHTSHVSGYSYEPAPTFIPSTSFNPHLPNMSPRPEWRRGSHPEYGTSQSNRGSPLLPRDDIRIQQQHQQHQQHLARSVSPAPAQTLVHRHSLPTSSLSHNLGSMSTRVSPHSSPSLQGGAASSVYYNTSARLVPAAFNGSPPNGSGSSGSSTPPIVPQDSSSSMALYQPVVPGPSAPAHFHVTTPSTFDSSLDQRPPYEPAFSAFHGPSSAPQQAYGVRAGDPVYYPPPGQYPGEVNYPSTTPGPRHFDPLARRTSTSPAPPMIAGLKRTREEEWAADAAEREAQRRRLSSYSQTGQAMHSVHFTYPSSPSLATPEMGVIRVESSQGHGPTLKEMGIRDAVSESLHGGSAYMKRPDGFSRDGPETSYSFISLPGNTIRKRPRRKFEEITRNYVCNWPDCTKAYGTLNHLNAHVTMQKHGPKRTPAEFKELRKIWRKQKREQHQQHQGPSHAVATAVHRASSELPADDDGGDDDDTGSLYGP